jgi:hypothetical protein
MNATATCKAVAATVIAMFATIGMPFKTATDGPASARDSLIAVTYTVDRLLSDLFAENTCGLADHLDHLATGYDNVDQDAAFEIDRDALASVRAVIGGTAPETETDDQPVYMTVRTFARMLRTYESKTSRANWPSTTPALTV